VSPPSKFGLSAELLRTAGQTIKSKNRQRRCFLVAKEVLLSPLSPLLATACCSRCPLRTEPLFILLSTAWPLPPTACQSCSVSPTAGQLTIAHANCTRKCLLNSTICFHCNCAAKEAGGRGLLARASNKRGFICGHGACYLRKH
jgi:hypothetical protein